MPTYNGPTNVIYISSEEMFMHKIKTKNKNINGDSYWFIIFYSNYAENCIYTEELWAKLSLKYSTAALNFAKVDVDLLPSLAKENNIETKSFFQVLPAIIVFKNGEEDVRYPGFDKRGKPFQVKYYREKEIVKNFRFRRFISENN